MQSHSAKLGRRFRPLLDGLEERRLLSTFTVANTLDDGGSGTLRWAIDQANISSGPDQIVFDSNVFNTPQTITLNGTQLVLKDSAQTTITGLGTALLSISGNQKSRVFEIDPGGITSISGLTITGGYYFEDTSPVSGNGGGLANLGTTTLTNCLITGNDAAGGGAGVHNAGILTMNGCIVSSNKGSLSTLTGGGLLNYSEGANLATATVTDTVFDGNTGYQGGGICNLYGLLELTRCTFLNNNGSNYGGGVCNFGTATVTDCTFVANTSILNGGYGGGLYNESVITVTASTFSNNSSNFGGGVFLQGDSQILTNCTFSGNSAKGSGGGLFFAQPGPATLTNCTISNNTATSRGGGLYNDNLQGATSIVLNNTIIAGNKQVNKASDVAASDISGPRFSGSNSLIGTGGSGGLVNGVNGNIVGVTNPGLTPLGNYGGPTQSMALMTGSPAIDAGNDSLAVDVGGNPLATDQRGTGFLRIQGTHADIGAVEFSPSKLSQTITFDAIARQTYGSLHLVNLTATANSNLPISFSILSGPATISGNVLIPSGLGSVLVRAVQVGDSTHAPADAVQTLTLAAAPLKVTAQPQTKIYGTNYSLDTSAITVIGLQNGETIGNPVLTSPGTAETAYVGMYSITPSVSSRNSFNPSNYEITYSTGTLTVTPALLIIQPAANQSKVYGTAFPQLTGTETGFVNRDTASVVNGSLGTTATCSSGVGDYAFNLGTLNAGANYTLAIANTPSFRVTPAALLITAVNETGKRGQVLPMLTASYSGFVHGDSAASLEGSLQITTTATSTNVLGVFPIAVQGVRSPNYAIIFVPGTLTVVAVPTTVLSASISVLHINRRKTVNLIVLIWNGPLDFVGAGTKSNYSVLAPGSGKNPKPVSTPIGRIFYDAGSTSLSLVTKNALDLRKVSTLVVRSASLHDFWGSLVVNPTSGSSIPIKINFGGGKDRSVQLAEQK